MQELDTTANFFEQQDRQDPLAHFRDEFYFPEVNGQRSIYFAGNSLGLQPKRTATFINKELEKWQKKGVEGHFEGENPWFHYHKLGKETMASLVGANSGEIVIMNSLTVNLHLLMVSFFRPTKSRHKIIMEAGAFPSDQYAIESQVRFHGYRPEDAIIEVKPRPGEHCLRTEDIVETIEAAGDSTALVLFSGVQYFSGQFFDMEAITEVGHKVGAKVGFDLAHAAGNVPLQLHDWDIDFAVWCTYKYLNAGPGNQAGAFIHEKHGDDPTIPRFAGWWGHNEEERFLMKKGFKPMSGADGWQLSNSNIMAASAVLASLEVFAEAGLEKLRKKSIQLTAFAEKGIRLLASSTSTKITILTPGEPATRGAQLSLAFTTRGKEIFEKLSDSGVIADWRADPDTAGDESGVIRIAPVPLYNNFEDVYKFTQLLHQAIS